MVLQVYRFQKRAFLLTVHGVNWRQHRRNCHILAKQKQTKWCLRVCVVTETCVLDE